MTTKNKIAEMMRRKAILEAQIKKAREAKKTVAETKRTTGLAYLIESELEKAEVVLAAKSIVDKLQKMAEDLAKINGDEIMPIMEPLKTAFGPQMAESFQQVVSEKVTATVTAVTQTKDAISAEVAKFQDIIDGKSSGNDMSAMGADEMGMAATAPGAMSPMDAGSDEMGDDLGAPEGDMQVDAEIDVDAGADPLAADGAFDSDPLAGEPVGRAKKESAQRKGKMVESASDRAIVTTFKKLIREGVAPVKAARRIAEKMSIDYADVVEVIRESSAGK